MFHLFVVCHGRNADFVEGTLVSGYGCDSFYEFWVDGFVVFPYGLQCGHDYVCFHAECLFFKR